MNKIYLVPGRCCAYSCELEALIVAAEKYHLDMVDNISEANTIIISASCINSEPRIRRFLEYTSKTIHDRPKGSKVILTGCAARNLSAESVKESSILQDFYQWTEENIDYFVHPVGIQTLISWLRGVGETESFGSIGVGIKYYDSKTLRIWLGGGCNNHCTFCKSNFQDFTLYSAEPELIKEWIDDFPECERLDLLAHNICQYGLDLKGYPCLPDLLEHASQHEHIQQINLWGLALKDAIKYHLVDAIEKSAKVHYIKCSLESGSDRLLRLIQKGYTKNQAVQLARNLQTCVDECEVSIISGFPSETIEDMETTLEVLKEFPQVTVDICEYQDSACVPSHHLPGQLTREKIQQHTQFYVKRLEAAKIPYIVVDN